MTKVRDKETDMQSGAQEERRVVWGSKAREVETSMFDGLDKTVRFEKNLSPKLIKAEFCN